MELPRFELGFAGTPLRASLVAAVLDGRKTTTTGLLADWEAGDEALPAVGDRYVLPGADERIVAVIEMVEVRVAPIAAVDLTFAIAEGEGATSVAEWRADHVRFFESDAMRAVLGDPGFTVDDDTMVVLQRFRVVERY